MQIRDALGDLPGDVLRGAADEVLAVLKDDRAKDTERKEEIEKLLNKIKDETFADIMHIGKRITDYSKSDDMPEEDKLDQELGVAVSQPRRSHSTR